MIGDKPEMKPDMMKGSMGFDSEKQFTSKPNPMIPEKPESKYELGYDAPGWAGDFEDYTVKEGDTLESIAKEYGCSPKEIAMLNRKQGNMISDEVNVGQKIKIPIMEEKEED